MTNEIRHRGLSAGGWQARTLMEQLGNIGTEVARAHRAQLSGNVARFDSALDRALELFDLTLEDPRWRGRRREIGRAREAVCDFLVGDNEWQSSFESLDAYFMAFAVAARSQERPDGDARSR